MVQHLKKYLLTFWQIIKCIVFPELREYNYLIIEDSEIRKMKQERAAVEYMRSRRRMREYSELVRAAFRKQYKVLSIIALIVLFLSATSYYYSFPIKIKIGDFIGGFLPFAIYLNTARKLLFFDPIPVSEEKIHSYNIVKTKKALRTALKLEARYMENNDKRIAGYFATIISFVIITLLISIKSISKPNPIDYLFSPLEATGDSLNIYFLNIHLNLANYFTNSSAFYALLSFFAHPLSVVLSGLQGSGSFFRSQGFKPNYIASSYIDSLSLSVLNPNQHETF